VRTSLEQQHAESSAREDALQIDLAAAQVNANTPIICFYMLFQSFSVSFSLRKMSLSL
jgi:hypothetical protein